MPARPALIALILCGAVPAFAGVVRSPQGLLSVDASAGQTLEGVLEQVSHEVSLEMLLIDPAVRSWPVTVSVHDKTTPEALQAILSAAGVNYVVMGNKLYAGDPGAAVAFVPSSGRSAEASPTTEAKQEAAEEPQDAATLAQYESEQQQHFDQLMHVMAPVEHPPGPRTVTLPFPDAEGNLRTVEVGPSQDGTVALPFPGADGKLTRVRQDPALRHVPPPGLTSPVPTIPAKPVPDAPAPPPDQKN